MCIRDRSETVYGVADQAINQSGGQNFLSCPEMVCSCGLGFSSGSSLSSGAGLGFIGRKSMRCLFTNGEIRLNLKKRNFFSEKYATVPSKWRFGVKNRSFVGFAPDKGVPKTIF